MMKNNSVIKHTLFGNLRESKASRIICAFLAINLLAEIISPTLGFALTSGAAQPEFSSFEPVATTDMVNDFTGNFTYNLPVLSVPGPDGGGYSMSLSYHSGVSSEEEASWVGFGWTLNPGAINRNKRGYPDEFNGVMVKQYHKNKANWTQTGTFDLRMEYNSSDRKKDDKGEKKGFGESLNKMKQKLGLTGFGTNQDSSSKDPADISLSISHTIRYNNYSGFSIANGIGVGVFGLANLNMNRSGAQNTYGFSVNPKMIMLAMGNKIKRKVADSKKITLPDQNKPTDDVKKLNRLAKNSSNLTLNRLFTAGYPIHSFEAPAIPYSVVNTSGASWNFSGSCQFNVGSVPIGFQVGLSGNINVSATEGEQTDFAYGYMNSMDANSGGDEHKLYDYQIEKESTFNKHDRNLGIPFNNADIFSATGANVCGGFKFLHSKIGSFYPNFTNSPSKIRQVGFEVGIGNPVQVGLDVGIGRQVTSVKGNWPKMPNMANYQFSSSKPQMRFTSDLGGEINYGDNYDDLLYSKIKFSKELDLGSTYTLTMDNTKSGNSSYIEYDQSVNSNNSMVTGIHITNKDGSKSNYNIPVLVKNEEEYTIGLTKFNDGNYLATQTLYTAEPLKNKTVMGHKVEEPYPAMYLLSNTTTYNYVDADTKPGPSDGDFGGWTKFNYRQVYGKNNTGAIAVSQDWFRYRSPYSGLNYNPGRLLDPNDGTGSMSSGLKQVYYLKTIETKSHIAFFVTNKTTVSTFTANFPYSDYPYLYNGNANSPISTVTANIEGSGTIRYDGVDAKACDPTTGTDPAAEDLTAKGNHALEKLEKIVLFSKSDLSTPLTTTYFDYDYSLCQGIPNSLAPANALSKEKGKLTLKKVWTESGGVIKSQIAPYEFYYEYFHSYSSEITNKYPWADTEFNKVYTDNDASQNPAYHPELLDAWGFYQKNGEERFKNMQPWVSQKNSGQEFDPAAWQLKRIKLPSGGEIHIQYEQKDYLSVQNQHATAMVSLLSDLLSKDGYSADESSFCINPADIEVNTSAEISEYVNQLRDYFLTQKNKLYFKVLYAMIEDAVPELNTENRHFEYVSGYTVVNDVTTFNNKIFLHLGETRSKTISGSHPDKTLPRYVCYQELLTNGGHNLGPNAGTYKSDDYTVDAYASNPVSTMDLSQIAVKEFIPNAVSMFTDWVTMKVANVKKKKACKKINYDLSYFKLPVKHAKKGGGIRVKRLLTYDPGIMGETGDSMIYGSEYIYKNEDGTSSGVATNEPTSIHEENALVSYLERNKQKWIEKITNGRDTKQFQGPLGESLLPAAEVVHSRIVVKNIHSGKSGTGYEVISYNTCKDYPMEVEFSTLSKKDKTYRKLNIVLPLGLFNFDMHRVWLTQGYLFKLNDMHGKLASKSVYGGSYTPDNFSVLNFTSKTSYNYSQPGEKIQSLVFDKGTKDFKWDFLSPGTEEDFTIYTSNARERCSDLSVEMDFNLTLPILPSLGFAPSMNFSDNMLCQHVTTKVVRQVSYLLSTTNVTDGVTQTTENLAFDRYTGDPVLTKTYDGFASPQQKIYTSTGSGMAHTGSYYSMNIPASWMYTDMEPKSNNMSNTNQLNLSAGNVVTYGTNQLASSLNNSNTASWSPYTNAFTNVVNATSTTYSNNWFNTSMSVDYPTLSNSLTLNAVNRFYYPVSTYSYKDEVSSANSSGGRIYKDGVCTNPFVFFDWLTMYSLPSATVAPQWYTDSKITRYSPYGYPLEEVDALSIKSSAKFGYGSNLPVVVAQNAGYGSVRFTDFEYGFTGNSHVTNTEAHSGRYGYQLSANPNYLIETSYPVYTHKGLSVKVWLKSVLSNNITNSNYHLKNQNPQFKVSFGGKDFDFTSLAQTGEWTLYSADISDFKGLTSGNYPIQFKYNYVLPNEQVFIDDVKLQPLDASVNCSVYYANNKLAAQFDDQHFGVFYEYNSKGQLVRKSIETERGKKTLQEQQYNTPLKNNNN